jgi:CrcB protein
MPEWLLLTIGGAVGTNARYFLGRWMATRTWSPNFPLGTFAINVTGSLLLAIVALLCRDRVTPNLRGLYVLLGVGFCGGYTTFSTFSVETWQLMEHGRWGSAALYSLGSVLAGLVAVALVMRFGKP